MFDKEQIKEIIPHRDPMLLVDEIVSVTDDKVHGRKILSGDELFFQGHFPGKPVMPGVFILESLAQTGAVALFTRKEFIGKIGYFAKVTNARFRRKIIPGETIDLKVIIEKIRGTIVMASGIAYVNNEKACEAEFTFAIGE